MSPPGATYVSIFKNLTTARPAKLKKNCWVLPLVPKMYGDCREFAETAEQYHKITDTNRRAGYLLIIHFKFYHPIRINGMRVLWCINVLNKVKHRQMKFSYICNVILCYKTKQVAFNIFHTHFQSSNLARSTRISGKQTITICKEETTTN